MRAQRVPIRLTTGRRRASHRRVRAVRSGRALCLVAASCVAWGSRPGLAGAQLSASLDANAAWATYDGYLASSAYTLTPGVSYVRGAGAAYANVALTRFESGSN